MPEGYEAHLVQRLQKRDEAAFNELVRLYQGKVFALVFRMLGDRGEAEDLAQEIFVTIFKSIDSFRGDSKLSTWIYRIASNHSKNRIKFLSRRARTAREEFDELADHAAADGQPHAAVARIDRPDETAEGSEMEKRVQRALASLDDEHRELIVLRDLEGLAYDEIQRITGLAEGTVKSRLHRARLALKEFLDKEGAVS